MATRSSCDDIDGIDNVLKTLSDRLMKDPRLDMVRTFENRALLNILRFQYYLQETNQAPQTAQTGAEGSHVQHADFGSPGNATLRATSTSPPNGKVSFHGRDLEIEEYCQSPHNPFFLCYVLILSAPQSIKVKIKVNFALDRVILQFVQIMQLARPLSKDMVDLENCIRNIFGPSQSDKGLPYPFTPYKEHHLDLRSLSYQNQICWKDRLWPIVSRKIERWKDNKTFQKFAKVLYCPRPPPPPNVQRIRYIVDSVSYFSRVCSLSESTSLRPMTWKNASKSMWITMPRE